jgi:hypothetical protein
VTDTPETRYTRSADGTNLAYQVSGDGPLELVFDHASAVPMDALSEDSGFVRVRRRLGTFSRTLWFDARVWAHRRVTHGTPCRERSLTLMSLLCWTPWVLSDRRW